MKNPPEHLRNETKDWFAQVAADFELEPHDEKPLTLAAEAWDRGVEAREAIEADGAYARESLRPVEASPGPRGGAR